MATNPWIVTAAVALGLAAGFGVGRLAVGPRGTDGPTEAEVESKTGGRRSARRPASPDDSFNPVDRHTNLLDEDDSVAAEDEGSDRPAGEGNSSSREGPDSESPSPEVARLRKRVEQLEADHVEMFGEPVAAPEGELPKRYGGSSISSAVRLALTEENIGGEVETVDCSEHPCIIFGRLEGDEEDMEEIERAASMSEYDDDVLTLLFWATSVERGGEAGGDGGGDGAGDGGEASGKQPETGLFALCFYSREERTQHGEELDRRIRARVMEYWNVERPGRK